MRSLTPFRIAADCPECGRSLRLRRNRRERNLFLGCSRFPVCRFTEDFDEYHAEVLAELHRAHRRPASVSEDLGRRLRDLAFRFHPDRNPGGLDPNDVTAALLDLRREVAA